MSLSSVIVLGIILLTFILFVLDILSIDISILLSVLLLLISGILTPREAFAGFSHPAVITISALFVVSAGLYRSGIIDFFKYSILNPSKSDTKNLFYILLTSSGISAFMNNTPVVMIFMPMILSWCRQHKKTASKFLMPLSFAAILGGTCTLIGTATNIIVSSILENSGYPGINMFELTPAAVILLLFGILFIILFYKYLIPERKSITNQVIDSSREYLVEVKVERGCPIIGKKIGEAGLRHLPGLFLAEIHSLDGVVSQATPETIIKENDLLLLTGKVESITDLLNIKGISPVKELNIHKSNENSVIVETVISPYSSLIGRTVREIGFRGKYNGVVLAIHRKGQRLKKKIGDIKLREGDTLLIKSSSNFIRNWADSIDLLVLSELKDSSIIDRTKINKAVGILVLMVLLFSFNVFDTSTIALLSAILIVLSGCLKVSDIYKSISWNVIIVIGSCFAFGTALNKTGLTESISNYLISISSSHNPIVLLAVIYLATTVLRETITNNAAAILMVPIAITAAQTSGFSYRPFVMAVLFSAATSVITPISYQTNLLVFGPGGYRFRDFIKFGGLLNLVLFIISLFVIPFFWHF